MLTLKSASHDNGCTGALFNKIITAQWEGMGGAGSARYESALICKNTADDKEFPFYETELFY